MREVTVPVDLVSEMKNIMGKVSTRQLLYLIVGGIIHYHIVLNLPTPVDGLYGYVLNALMDFPFILMTFAPAFLYLARYDLYLDKYLWFWWQSKKQTGTWYYHGS
ncbi:MAG: PrgI family protein [Bacillaceae bacterium]|nr:PrgI family protein [Bacillaceae bacterium]